MIIDSSFSIVKGTSKLNEAGFAYLLLNLQTFLIDRAESLLSTNLPQMFG